MRSITSLAPSLDIATELFALYRDALAVTKGAFLLHDRTEGTFAPWALAGFDRTTEHRIRLPEEFLVALPGATEGSVIEVDRGELAKLEPYFSTREFGLLERAWLLPFVFDGQIVALLFAGASRLLDEASGEVLQAIEESAALAAPLIRTARAAVRDGGSFDADSQAPERLARLLRKADAERHHVVIVRLDVSELLRMFLAGSKGQDPYRLRRDLLSVLGSMVTGSGELIRLRPDVLALALASRKPHDERLVVHQIASGLAGLFGKSFEIAKLEPRVWTFPRATSSIDELVAEVIR